MSERAAGQIERIDGLLEGGELDAEASEALIAMLRPGEGSRWPDLRVVLHVAEHPAIFGDLKVHEVPDALERAIVEALEANLPLLGMHAYGPTYKLAQLARTRLDQERRKFERISEHLRGLEDEEGVEILGRYLDTDPAPMFVQQMRQLHASLFEKLPEREAHGSLWAACVGNRDTAAEAPVEWLERPPEDPEDEQAVDAVRAWLEELEEAGVAEEPESLSRALAGGNPDEQRLAGALMAWTGAESLAAGALRAVLEGGPAAPQLAVFAAVAAPQRARTVFSQFLAEVTLQNPDLPEAELTDERIRAILAARSVLPRLDSPLETMAPEELPSTVPTEEMAAMPERMAEFWDFWTAVTTSG